MNEAKIGLTVAPIGQAYGGRCSADATATIVQSDAGVVVVRTEEEQSVPVLMCFSSSGEGRVCTDKDGDDVPHQTACGNPNKITPYTVFDIAKGVRTLRVTHDEAMEIGMKSAEQTQLSVDSKALSIKGPGCSESLPLAAAAGAGPKTSSAK